MTVSLRPRLIKDGLTEETAAGSSTSMASDIIIRIKGGGREGGKVSGFKP